MNGCYQDGGEPTTKSAAAALAQGHPKATPVPVKWGMKDQQDPSIVKPKGKREG